MNFINGLVREAIIKFLARSFGIRLLQLLRQPALARVVYAFSTISGFKPRPPKGAVSTTREWTERQAEDGRKYTEVYSAQTNEQRLPRTIDGQAHWQFRQRQTQKAPDVFFATVPGGKVVGPHGAVVTGDDLVLGDLSREWFFEPQQHSLLFKLKLPKPRILNGTSANLATASGWNYYHWILDVLPRFGILEKGGIDLRSVDWFILNGGKAHYMPETLAWLDIPKDKQIFAGPGTHYQCDRLLAPSLPGIPGQTPPWVAEFLRSKFSPASSTVNSGLRLYISRSRSRCRKFTNEPQVRELLLKRGFREVFSEELSFRDQVNLFASAEAVVAPHGAGLTNLVFCRPRTKVIEIFSPDYVNGCFWTLANWAGLNYCYLLGTGPRPPEGHDPHQVEKNIQVDIRQLEQTLKLAEIC